MRRSVEQDLIGFINQKAEHKSVLILEGARQVGKTYAVQAVLANVSLAVFSFNLEKDLLFRSKLDRTNDFDEFTKLLTREYGFQENSESIVFIDEAQESEKLGSYVRLMKEVWANKSVILTGSSMTRLFHNSRVPVGRVEYLRLYPLSFVEFLVALGKEDLLDLSQILKSSTDQNYHKFMLGFFDQYLNVGGLPAVVNSFLKHEDNSRQDNIRMEISLSQKDDFYRKESDLKQYLFEDTMKAVANLLGYPFKYSAITQNYRDAISVLSIMEKWHIVLRCEQKSFSTTAKYHPKLYLYDVGIAKQLREGVLPSLSVIDNSSPDLRTSLGGLIENAVYLNLLAGKGFLNEIFGWKKGRKQQIEVDFVLKHKKIRCPIEVKASLNYSPKMIHGILQYLNFAKEKFGILISGSEFREIVHNDKVIINLPVYACDLAIIKRCIEKYCA